jgi:hypothetical protein
MDTVMMTSAVAWLTLGAALQAPAASPRIVRFDSAPGQAPPGFTCALTGNGRPGVWRVQRDAGLPQAEVLAQTDEDATGYRFPHCVLDDVSATDVDLAVRFKAVRGATDRAAGLVWRYRDPDNYYIVRANALEGNVVLYKVEKGKRTDLDPKGSGLFTYGKKASVPAEAWNTLRVVAQDSLFRVFLNGQELFQVEDATFTGPGKVGVWTKADSVTYFDDLEITVTR